MTNQTPDITRLVYDNYEISGCRRIDDAGLPAPDGTSTETCDDADAQFWTLYGHIDGQGVEAIGDFASREAAERAFFRITGQPFTGSYQACPRLRLMHAAPALLAALEGTLYVLDENTDGSGPSKQTAIAKARAAVAAATAACPPWISDEPDIHALLASRRQVAAVWSIEDVQEIRPELTDEQAWEVLQAAERYHDAAIGISWDVLGCHADLLFGDASDGDEPEEA